MKSLVERFPRLANPVVPIKVVAGVTVVTLMIAIVALVMASIALGGVRRGN